jgi:transposase InsO family protein
MRAFDRDLIRGGHYGQRSCEPHPKAEHMAAPTNAAYVKKALANSEPSTHGTYPRMIVSDNGTEFTSNTILTWQQEHDVEWHYIAPGNRCRMASWKASTAADRIDPARVCEPFHRLGRGPSGRILRTYARYYNEIRTHRSLDKDAPVS